MLVIFVIIPTVISIIIAVAVASMRQPIVRVCERSGHRSSTMMKNQHVNRDQLCAFHFVTVRARARLGVA